LHVEWSSSSSGQLAGKASVAQPCAPPTLDRRERAAIERAFGPLNTLIQSARLSLPGRQVFGVLSFVYLHHYLNWLSKVDVIRWHRIGGHRAGALIALYVCDLACYAVSFPLGFILAMVLSQIHVMLELPLNVASVHMPLRPTEVRG
jgi:hypothetical protein